VALTGAVKGVDGQAVQVHVGSVGRGKEGRPVTEGGIVVGRKASTAVAAAAAAAAGSSSVVSLWAYGDGRCRAMEPQDGHLDSARTNKGATRQAGFKNPYSRKAWSFEEIARKHTLGSCYEVAAAHPWPEPGADVAERELQARVVPRLHDEGRADVAPRPAAVPPSPPQITVDAPAAVPGEGSVRE